MLLKEPRRLAEITFDKVCTSPCLSLTDTKFSIHSGSSESRFKCQDGWMLFRALWGCPWAIAFLQLPVRALCGPPPPILCSWAASWAPPSLCLPAACQSSFLIRIHLCPVCSPLTLCSVLFFFVGLFSVHLSSHLLLSGDVSHYPSGLFFILWGWTRLTPCIKTYCSLDPSLCSCGQVPPFLHPWGCSGCVSFCNSRSPSIFFVVSLVSPCSSRDSRILPPEHPSTQSVGRALHGVGVSPVSGPLHVLFMAPCPCFSGQCHADILPDTQGGCL